MTTVWILGRGGMLGSCIASTMERETDRWRLRTSATSFSWDDSRRLEREFAEEADRFLRDAASPWLVVWAAGVSVMGSPPDQLACETATFRALLSALSSAVRNPDVPGAVFFASSAGALYGEDAGTATEETPLAPCTPYGEAKREQEETLRTWVQTTPNVRAVIGRISTLFGETQNLGKAQGLITRLSRSIIGRQTLPLFVPLSTARDYLYAPDCAAMIVSFLASLSPDAPRTITKIFAAEKSTTIAELLRIFRDVTKHPPRVVPQRTELTGRYTPTISLRSVTVPLVSPPATPLPDAIHRVHLHHLRLHAEGKMG